MTRHRLSFGVSLLVVGVVAPRVGQAQDDQIMQQQILLQQQQAQSQQSTVQVPEHLQIEDHQFDGTVNGFRAYLETTKSSDPSLYGQLGPDVARLESKQDTAKAALVAGVVIGLASLIYGIAGGDDCVQPPITDPHFGADSDAWGACNERNLSKMATFGFVGLGAMALGGVISYASRPSRQDLLDLVNKHNQLSPHPMRLQIGYDPTQRFAFSGATVSF